MGLTAAEVADIAGNWSLAKALAQMGNVQRSLSTASTGARGGEAAGSSRQRFKRARSRDGRAPWTRDTSRPLPLDSATAAKGVVAA